MHNWYNPPAAQEAPFTLEEPAWRKRARESAQRRRDLDRSWATMMRGDPVQKRERETNIARMNAAFVANLRWQTSNLPNMVGQILGKALGAGTAPLTAGLQGLGAAARAARPGGAEPIGAGGFTGISDLSRVLQMGIFGSYQERMQQKQADDTAKIEENTGGALKYLAELAKQGLGVFAPGE